MSHTQARLLLFAAALFWGVGTVAQHCVLDHIGPFTAVGLRSSIAALVILPFTLMQPRDAKPFDRQGYSLALLVVLSFALAATLEQTGYGMTSVSNGTFLISTCAVFTPIGLWLALKRRTSLLVWPAAIAVMCGAALMSGGATMANSSGDVVMLLSAVFYAAWTIAMGEFVCRYGRSVRIVAAQFVLAGLICSSIGFRLEAPSASQLAAATPLLLFLGCFSSGAAYIVQSLALRRLNAAETAIISSGESIFGASAAALLLDERLSPAGLAGAAVLTTGILIVQLPPRLLRKHRLANFRDFSQPTSGV